MSNSQALIDLFIERGKALLPECNIETSFSSTSHSINITVFKPNKDTKELSVASYALYPIEIEKIWNGHQSAVDGILKYLDKISDAKMVMDAAEKKDKYNTLSYQYMEMDKIFKPLHEMELKKTFYPAKGLGCVQPQEVKAKEVKLINADDLYASNKSKK